MISKNNQELFLTLMSSQFNVKELGWISTKTSQLINDKAWSKFNVFFSLVSRFINDEVCNWDEHQLATLENIYPGFAQNTWNKQELARIQLMLSLDADISKNIIISFFETAEIKEQIALYKGLYLLDNAKDFTHQFTEGIRTNIVDVFDALAFANPFAKTYLNDDAWNQLILKCFFMDRPLYTVEGLDDRKNKDLADMLQDYVKERWAAGRNVPIEAWRIIEGYLRDDVKELITEKTFEGVEEKILENIITNKSISTEDWKIIGKNKE